MKRVLPFLCLTAVLMGVLVASALGRGDGDYEPALQSPVYLVAASNAPAAAKAVAGRVCSGTNDQDNIQDAIDWVASQGGGVVELTLGRFMLGPHSASVAANGTGNASPSGQNTVVTCADTSLLAVGRSVRISGGGLEAENVEGVYTIVAINPNMSFTLAIKTATSFTGITWRQLRWALRLRVKVLLRGQGIYATELKAMPNSACNFIQTLETANSGFGGVTLLSVNGDKANQGGITDGDQNGIVLNAYAYDVLVRDVFIMNSKGDGIIANCGWGLRVNQNVIEWCTGAGMVCGGTSSSGSSATGYAKISDNKIVSNGREGLRLTLVGSCDVLGNELGTPDGTVAGRYGMSLLGATQNRILGNRLASCETAGFPGAVLFGEFDGSSSYGNIIVGNHISPMPSGSAGLHFKASYGVYNIVGPNVYDATAAGDPILDEAYLNWIDPNNHTGSGTKPRYFPSGVDLQNVKNISGAEIAAGYLVAMSPANAIYEVILTAAANEARFVGCARAAIASAAFGMINRTGYAPYFRVNADLGAIVKGDMLAVSATAGCGKKAASGDTVVAIADSAKASGQGNVSAYILERPMRMP